jgi:Eco57I restriction-modification methylase
MAGLFDERHNPVWRIGLSGDGAAKLLEFWQRVDPDTGAIAHDFTDPEWDTRFLGDLYQDLSEDARKRYALLQTPEFVEEFILDRTLTPAIEEFGYREVRLIDPTCGSGHFLLGAFALLFDLWVKNEPATNARELAQRALDQVYGVDVNPYAAAVARFRLLLAALRASQITRLKSAPAFRINVAAGDSLLHGPNFGATTGPTLDLYAADSIGHVYQTEDREDLARILGRQYQAVVGNPPYITVKDKALNQAYRDRYASCSGKYSLAVPFIERFFQLAIPASPSPASPAGEGRGEGTISSPGFVGMITANSFMKREFGKKLIEQHIPRWDLTHVIDTSGAYIPGHGTPTVILFGRHRPPIEPTVRAVMGIRGEPSTPEDPARGLVWTAIVEQVDRVGSVSEYVSVSDVTRESFGKHPWSIGGGGAAELKELLDEQASSILGDVATAIGITAVTGEDDLYMLPDTPTVHRLGIELSRRLLIGEKIRDWSYDTPDLSIWLYDERLDLVPLDKVPHAARLLWLCKSVISHRKRFGTPMLDRGLQWYEWQELYTDKLRTPLSIAFAFVATHNHFVLDRGGKVFNRSAPVIKLPPDATEDDHLALLGLLNSSVACFWMKQVFYPKATVSGDVSIEKGRPEANRYEFAGTGLNHSQFPACKPGGIGCARSPAA